MGNEQSSGSRGRRTQEEPPGVPYTNYSVPAGTRGGLRARSASTPASPSRATSGAAPAPPPPSKHNTLVVVSKGGDTGGREDETMSKLRALPKFNPLLGQSGTSMSGACATLDASKPLRLLSRVREHLKLCGDAVSFDQNAIAVRMKEIDFALSMLMNVLTERQKKLSRQAEQIHRIQELDNVLTKVRANLSHTGSLLDSINQMLPPGERLEPFKLDLEASSATSRKKSGSR